MQRLLEMHYGIVAHQDPKVASSLDETPPPVAKAPTTLELSLLVRLDGPIGRCVALQRASSGEGRDECI